MKFRQLALHGAWLIEPEPVTDERGAFTRIWCRREWEAHGLCPDIAQVSVSVNTRRGTLRGMHVQREPHAEAKVVRCLGGALHDVLLDLRPGSPTFRTWVAEELSAANGRLLYVPPGVAHGFQTLADDTVVEYLISTFHEPSAASGVRFDDPAFGISWPLPVTAISARDRQFPDFAGPAG